MIVNKTWYSHFFQTRSVFMDVFFTILAVAFLGFLSQLYIPLWPVPITMQTFGIFLVAFFFGAFRGTITLLMYLLVGIMGFAVFAQGKSGILPLLGPSGGYLIGFVFMAAAIGFMVEKGWGSSFKGVLMIMFIGEIILYAFGLLGLYIYFLSGNPEAATLANVFMKGFVPFIIGDGIKALAAASLFPAIWKMRSIREQ